MDQQQAQNINQASEELTDSARQAFQMLADRTVSLQESNLRLTQEFFQNWVQQLQSQTEGNQQAAQTIQEQSERQQQALQTLTQESTNAYSEFLNSALSFYQETLRSATQVAQNNMQAASQATQQGVQAAGQAAQQGVQAASQAASQSAQAATQATQQSAETANQTAQQNAEVVQEGVSNAQRAIAEVPIEGYDELNVEEIVARLDSLSNEELGRVREYEQRNKNRSTLMEQINARAGTAS
ncbi:MAG: hypothetical protein AVDCRST_MAG14-1360 [uncultured Rubrobacteraceae bacterium]|uniref:Uncharacterized protein n=1 Tax=uncultured Rubrobacteraceae bacterium TaxID=349277 RepID=A0A6J4R1E6_9ACTN|nr:MAG: hypothetical protein AVDCRST_MAG14-1360 [uncultured Rubrobacteraceae bacterium]